MRIAQGRPQLVRDRHEELVLERAGALGRGLRRLCLGERRFELLMRFEQVCGLGGPCLAERAFGGVRDGHLAEQPGQRRAEQQRDTDDRNNRELDVATPCRKDVVFVERHRDAERDAPDTLEGDPLNGTALDNGPAVRRLRLSHRGVEHRIATRRLSQRVDGRRFADEDVA